MEVHAFTIVRILNPREGTVINAPRTFTHNLINLPDAGSERTSRKI